jgi:hypothetical protein
MIVKNIVKKIVNRTVNSWMRKKSFIALLLQLSATRLWLVVEFHHQGYHIHILVLLSVIELQAVLTQQRSIRTEVSA